MTLEGVFQPSSLLQELLSNYTVAGTLGTGLPRVASKTITFDGTAGKGAIGTVTVFTVSGLVLVEFIAGKVGTSLTGATATASLGVTGQATLFIGATTATTLTTSAELWATTTATAGGIALASTDKGIIIDANVIITVAVAAVASGVMEVDCIWRPLSPSASVS